jgi:UDP-glucose 4-epimerase/UDP-glucuronate decarboxylase
MGSEHVIPQFIERALRREDPFRIYGATNTRAFCYVSDAVDASVRLARLPMTEPVLANIGDDRCEISMMDLAERVFRTVGFSPAIEVHAAPAGSPARRVPNLTLLRRLTGYQPRVPLDDGIVATCRWYADHPSPGLGAV